MEEKKRDVVDELMGVLDSMSECAGKMIDATKVMIGLLSSGRLQLCDDAGENLTEEEPEVEEQQEPEAEPQPDFGPDLFFEELAEEPLLLDAGTGTGKKANKYFNQQFHVIIFLKYSNILTLCNREHYNPHVSHAQQSVLRGLSVLKHLRLFCCTIIGGE